MQNDTYDVVVVGGGPAGATAADDLALQGHKVLLLDRQGRIKPCGGAIPPRLIKDFHIPDELLVAKARAARMVSPKDKKSIFPLKAALWAWSTATSLTNGCANAPSNTARCASAACLTNSRAMTTVSVGCISRCAPTTA